MKWAWLSHTRPDVQYEVSQLAHVVKDLLLKNPAKKIKFLSLVLQYTFDSPGEVSNSKSDFQSIRVVGFLDAFIANNYDNSTQLGFILFIVDKYNRVVPVNFKSYKGQKSFQSVLACESIAFGDIFDREVSLENELNWIHPGYKTPTCLLIDSKSLFGVISKDLRTSIYRLMLDNVATKEAFTRDEISDIG